LSVRLQTNRYTPAGYVSTSYTAAEIDAICAYAPELHRCYLIPVDEISGRRALHLRLDPTRNNQAQGIKWARDYELRAMILQIRSEQKTRIECADSYTFRA
jgi:PD-(D/E)XK endonuclease